MRRLAEAAERKVTAKLDACGCPPEDAWRETVGQVVGFALARGTKRAGLLEAVGWLYDQGRELRAAAGLDGPRQFPGFTLPPGGAA